MTKHGFYSIVEKKQGEFHVRGREKRDLENLLNGVPLPDSELFETPEADYRFRIVVDRDAVQLILQFLGQTLEYSNFKGKIDRTPDQGRKPYHEVWHVMADALGAYGANGKKPHCLCCLHHMPTQRPRQCPICNHVFQGNGWDGIDAHWKAKHGDKMSYETFWSSLCDQHR